MNSCSSGPENDHPAYITSELGKRLWAIRQRIIASGERLLDADEIDHEVRARRGRVADDEEEKL